jgi:hypothetical protein
MGAAGDDPSRKLRSRARELRRHAELIVGEMLIEMRTLWIKLLETLSAVVGPRVFRWLDNPSEVATTHPQNFGGEANRAGNRHLANATSDHW